MYFFIYMGKLQGHNPLKQSHVTLLKQKTTLNKKKKVYSNWLQIKYKFKYKN